MVGKLLKYEIPALGRKLVPLYFAWMATAVLLGFSANRVASKTELIMLIAVLLYIGIAAAIFVMGVVMIVQRYNVSLLGDEGYFMHVLPVSAGDHIACKTISAIIWVTLSFVVLVVTAFLITLSGGAGVEVFRYIGSVLSQATVKEWLVMLEFIVVCIFSLSKSILAVYAAITIGHQAKQHTVLTGIVAYLAILVFETIIGKIATIVLEESFFYPTSTGQMALLLGGAFVMTLVLCGIYFAICKELMEKRLNLA